MALLRLFSVVAAALPTALYVLLFWWVDRHEKEPRALLLGAFVWGAVPSVMLSLIIESWLARPLSVFGQGYASVVGSTLIAPPIEEVAKGLALWGLYRWARAEMDGDLDGIVYGPWLASALHGENIFHDRLRSGLAWATIIPVCTGLLLNHALFTGKGELCTSTLHKGAGSRRGSATLALLAIAVTWLTTPSQRRAMHLSLLLNWAGAVGAGNVVLSWRREVAWMREHLAEEVSLGILTELSIRCSLASATALCCAVYAVAAFGGRAS